MVSSVYYCNNRNHILVLVLIYLTDGSSLVKNYTFEVDEKFIRY